MNTSAKLRVLHIVSGDLWAGAEAQLFQLMRAFLRDPALQLTAVLLNEGELAARLRSCGVAVHVLDESKLSTTEIALQLARICRKMRPEIIHTHRLKENILGSLAALVTPGAVSVRTVHGAPEHAPKGVAPVRRAVQLADRLLGTYVQKKIVAVSSDLERRLWREYRADHIVRIWNGIDVGLIRALSRHDLGLRLEGDVRFGIAGRLVPIKRVDLFLESARELLDHNGGDIHFYIIGDGPLMSELVARATTLGLSGACHFLGFQTNPLPILSKLDALVLTSDHEGLPMIALEAMALGIPVIAHEVGGLGSQDPRLFAQAMMNAVRSTPVERNSTLSPDFDVSNTVECYKNLYLSLTTST
jgi:glycosyltransferase involved in cell wall biosynthesis